MSKTIDERVVEMRFDNAQFERNVRTSMSTLEKLKQSLQLSGITNSIEQVGQKFSAFETMAVGALLRIGSQAVDTAEKLVKSLSIDQITAGWSKYADKTRSVQTIMSATSQTWEKSANEIARANYLVETGFDKDIAPRFAALYQQVSDGTITMEEAGKALGMTGERFSLLSHGLDQVVYSGSQMEYVNDQLEKLNWFTDETSYSYMDMVSNIGKFTANNIPLEKSVTAMQGISTWAALSGANVGEAGRAMYNLSQAISVGAVKLQDWKSIENANMATAEFKQIAIETAASMQLLKDKGNGVYETMAGNAVSVENFNQNLSDAWFTSEVLLSTLDKYGGFAVKLQEASDATGLGATRLLGFISDFKDGSLDIGKALEAVHAYAEDTSMTAEDLTGILAELSDTSYELGERAFRAAQEAKTFQDVIDYVKEAVGTGWMKTFENIFGNYEEAKQLWSDLAEEMYSVFVESGDVRNAILKEWKELGGRDDLIQAFWNIFHAITGIISAVKGAFDDIFNPIFSDAENGATRLQTLTARLKEFTERLKITDDETGELNETGQKIKSTFRGVFAALGIVKDVIVALIKPIKELFTGAGSGVLDFSSNMGEMLVKLRETIKQSGVLEKITERLSGVFRALNEFIGNTVELFRGVSYWEGGGGIAGIFESMFDGVNNVIRLFFNAISALTGKDLGGVRDKIITTLQKIRDKVVDACGPLSDIFEKVKTGISKAFESIKKVFGKFGKIDTGGISTLSEKTDKAFKPITALLEGVKKIFGAVWELLKKLAPVFSAVFTALGNFLGRIGEGIANVIKNADFSKLLDMVKGGLEVGIGVQIFQFIKSLKDGVKGAGGILSSVEETFEGIKTCITGLSDCIEAYEKNINAKTLLTIAGAIGILALSMLVLSSIDGAKLESAILAVTLMFAELVGSFALLNKMGDTKKIKKVGTTMIELAAAVLVLAIALKKIAGLNTKQLAIGLVGITVLLAEVIIAAKVLGNDKDSGKMMKGATNAIAFAAAIAILASSLKKVGSMRWEELAKGIIGITVLMIEMVAAAKILGNDKDSKRMLKGAANAVVFAAAMRILASVLKSIAKMSWEDLAKGLVGLTVILTEMVIAVKIIGNDKDSKRMLKGATNMVVFTAAVVVLAECVKQLAKLSWENLAKGLVGVTVIMVEMVAAAKLMNSSGGGAVAMIAAAGALLILSTSLKALAKLSWEQITKGLVAIAGAFTIIGIAGYLLKPIVSTILKLAAAMALMGVAAALFGAGLLLVSAALTAFAGSVEIIVDAIIQIIIRLVTAIPDIFRELAKSLNASLGSIIEMLVTVAKAALMALYEVIPLAVDIVLDLILSTLRSIANNIQPIIEALLDIVVGAINGLTTGIPKIISATVELFKAIIDALSDALSDALGGFDLGAIAEAIAAVALLDVLMVGIAAMTVSATVAVAPLPLIAKHLNDFIVAARPFLDEIQNVNPASLQGAKALAETILILTANGVLDGLTSWFTGGSSMVDFGKQLAEFAPYMKKYGKSIEGVDNNVVEASANAALSLAKFATEIPRSGGLGQLLIGEHDLSKFAEDLASFGPAFKKYSDSIKGVDISAVKASSVAAQSITEFVDTIPRSGGLAQLLIGDHDLSKFADDLSTFGPSFKKYSDSVKGVNAGAVKASSTAAKSITEFIDTIPRSGGLAQLLIGDHDLSKLAKELADFGPSFKKYSDSVKGVNASAVKASSTAAKSITEFVRTVPRTGGLVQLFTGKNSLKDLAKELVAFGPSFKKYSDSVKGVNASAVRASSTAAKSITEFVKTIPKSGGLVQLITGENSLKDFAKELESFGPSFKSYSDSVKGVNATAVTISSTAAKSINEFVRTIPKSGGLVQLITGENSLKDFAEELKDFGPAFKAYSDSIIGVDSEAVSVSSTAAKSITEFANTIPKSGGLVQLITGKNSLSTFAKELKEFGPAFKSYANSVYGIDPGSVTASASAAKSIAEFANNIPKSGGLVQLITGENSLGTFAKELKEFGPAFKKYGDSIVGIDAEAVESSATAAKSIAEFAAIVPPTGGLVQLITGENSLKTFGEELEAFGPHFKKYATSVEGITEESVTVASNAALIVAKMADTLPEHGGVVQWFTGEESISKFGEELATFGPNFKTFADSVDGITGDSITIAANAALKTAQMAAALPKEGGVKEWIEGKASLSAFGTELATFGPQFRKYIDALEGVTIDSNLEGSLDGISKLVKSLPEHGGIKQWFTGDATLSDFGEELELFGESLQTYFTEVSNLSGVDQASKLFDTLVKLCNEYDDVDYNLVWVTEDILDSLTKIYERSFGDYTGLITGADAMQQIYDAVAEYLSHFGNSFSTISKEYYPLFSSFGKEIVSEIASAMDDKQRAIIPSTAYNICSTIMQRLNARYSDIKNVGARLVSGFCEGIKSGIPNVRSTASDMAEAAVNASKDALDVHSPSRVFYQIGSYLVDGFCNGIDANIFKAEARAKAMAKAASTAAKNELEVKSPSRVFYEIGDNTGKGFVNALDDKGKDAYRAGQSLARQSVEGTARAIRILSDAISNGVDTEPTIRPVLDLSDVTHGAHRLSAMLSQSHALSISADLASRSNGEGALVGSNGSLASISFTQNNYSPKALSRFEIYRNTQNLLNVQRRMVNH